MAEAWKEIRVFISSTFRDMQAERDHLVRFVFPRLREELAKRRIRMVDVDLRWGVTADQDAFELCMREIENCHPRFLCMLGGRYGWVPPPKAIASDFMSRLKDGETAAGALGGDELALLDRVYPTRDSAGNFELLAKPETVDEVNRYNEETTRAVSILQRAGHVETERSITASEVYFGALDRLHSAIFRYFYFRDDAATRSIPDSHAGIYREPAGSFGEGELAKLEARIRGSRGVVLVAPGEEAELPVPVFDYPCRWDDATKRVTGLREFGERVYADLMASVEAQFGPAAAGELPWQEEERAAIEAFVEPRVERYVVGSRGAVLDRLHAHLAGAGGTGIAVVVGEPGSGKSALLARLWRELERGTPDHPARTDALVLPHFVGASAASTNLRQLLRRLCFELQAGTGIEGELPDDYEKLRETFPDFLERAARAKPVLLLVDAVNQLDPDYQAHAMRWLPDTLPAGARAVVTVIGRLTDECAPAAESVPALLALHTRRAGPEMIPLRALSADDAQEIVGRFLARYRKSLDAAQRAALLAKADAGKPLYLLTALEELRTLGVYEEITKKIREMPGEARALFRWILVDRLENDDGFRDETGELVGPTLVRRWCSLLAAGRFGMTERELAELVAPARARRPDDEEAPQPDELGNVAALQRLLRPYLMTRGELLDFFHGQLKEAVLGEYLDEEQERLDTHRAIARHFLRRADPAGDQTWGSHDARALSELPHHLTEAKMWDEVYAVLTDLGFLEEKCTHVAVAKTGEGDDEKTVYNGVFELQEDYRRALAVWPEEQVAAG
jgi:hypothetical protein